MTSSGPVSCRERRAVTSCYAHKPGIAQSLNDWLSGLADRWPTLIPLGTLHQDDPDLAVEARRCLDTLGFRGFKIHCGVQRVAPDDPRLFPLYEAALDFDRPVLVHAGSGPYPASWLGFRHFHRLMRRYPGLKVQVAHLGMWEVEDFLSLTERYPGVYFDLAAVTNRHLALPVSGLDKILRRYPERVLYGSDFPLIEEPYPRFLDLLRSLELPDAVYRGVTRENAEILWGYQPLQGGNAERGSSASDPRG